MTKKKAARTSGSPVGVMAPVAVIASSSERVAEYHRPNRAAPRWIVAQEEPPKIRRERRTCGESTGEGLGQRGRPPPGQHLRQVLPLQALQDGVEGSDGMPVDPGPQPVLAAEVMQDEPGRDTRFRGDLANGHRVETALGEQPQRRIPNQRPGGDILRITTS